MYVDFGDVAIYKQKMNASCTGGNGTYLTTKQTIYEFL